ncbi:hypothetical protein [Rhodococcus erythropolis]
MSDTTSKDDKLRDYIRVWANHRLAISDEQAEKNLHTHYWVDADSLVELLKQYGIQERIDEAELLRLKQYTVPDPIKPRSQKIRAVSVFDIDTRIAELTALKTKQEVAN